MIKVFGSTDTNFTSNGDCVLRPLKAKVHKKDNGDYYLDLETSLEYVDYFTEGRIVTANTPTGDQAFRIGNVTKTKSKIVSKCYHVFYDSENYLIADSYVVDKTCDQALSHLNSATEPTSEFTTISDVLTVNSYRCVRKSLYEAVNDVLERWGGHLVRDNFNIAIRATIGTDNGITVQYKKNLKDISCQENWNNVVTKLLPVGKDGILLNAVNPSASIYVSSAQQYTLPYTKTVSFSQDSINEEDYPTETAYKTALVNDLYNQAVAYVEKNSLPQVSYTLKANLDRVTDIGDTVEVIDDRLGVNMMTHVVGFEYDCIFEKYTSVEFGNFAESISGLVGNINAQTTQTVTNATQAIQDNILGIMEKSYVFYDGEKILVLDSLPKESAQKVIKIDNSGIGFSQNGINGTYTSKWNITGALTLASNMILVGNLTETGDLSVTGDVSINSKQLKDFITDQGTTDGWTWRKYASTVEAWKQITIDSASWTQHTIQDLYTADVDVSLPFTINDSIVNATVESASGLTFVAKASTDTTKTTLSLVTDTTTNDIIVNLYIKGSYS